MNYHNYLVKKTKEFIISPYAKFHNLTILYQIPSFNEPLVETNIMILYLNLNLIVGCGNFMCLCHT